MSSAHGIAADQLRAFISRIERLEEEKRTIADDIKEVKAEAKGCGFDLPTINAILKLRKKDAAERDEAQAMLDLYMSALGMLPLFESEAVPSYSQSGLSYADEKGRGAGERLIDAAREMRGMVGELTDTQESDQPDEAVVPATAAVASDEMAAQDDVGATASSTNSNSQPTKGESDAKSAHDDSVFEEALIDRRRQDAAQAERQQPIGHENAPVESAADTISTTNPNSQRPPAADTAGEARLSSPVTSPATHSDDIDLTIPDFLRRTEGGYPKREAEAV